VGSPSVHGHEVNVTLDVEVSVTIRVLAQARSFRKSDGVLHVSRQVEKRKVPPVCSLA
jgi:hypothetical protein